jgi:hypothetical protein
VAVGFVFGCVAFEAAYRCHLYHDYLRQYSHDVERALDPDSATDSTSALQRASVFDPHIGYRYRPGVVIDLPPPHPGQSPQRFRTNVHGHVCDENYPVVKPSDEFRVAVIGDSFTAGVTNSVRWPAILEQQLNSDPDWVRRVAGRKTRVINHALDGIGVCQFQAVYEHDAQRFEPDMAIASFVIAAAGRRQYFRGRLPDGVRGPEAAREFTRAHLLAPLPWLGPTPEFLARTPLGTRLGLRSRLNPALSVQYADDDEAVAATLASLRAIRRTHPQLVVLYHPLAQDLEGPNPPWAAMRSNLFDQGADLHIVDMGARLSNQARGPELVRQWYQLPHDPHMNDEGLRVYAAAAARVLVERTPP